MAQINLKQIKGLTAGSILFLDNQKVTENNSQLYWDNVNNRLGIGTISPSQKLDIIGAIRMSNTNSDLTIKTSYSLLQHYDNSKNDISVYTSTSNLGGNSITIGGGSTLFNSATSILFNTATNNNTINGSTRMLINYIGNVGIGTNIPTEKLDINGNVKANGVLKLYDITNTQKISLNPDGDSYIKTKLAIGPLITGTPQAVLHIQDVNPRIIRLQDRNYIDTYADIDFKDGSLKFFTDPQQIRYNSLISFSIDNLERMRIKDDGNVGIGTTSPTEKLDVIGNIKADGILKLYDITDTQKIELNPNGTSYINNEGSVGIGTTTPNDKLDIDGDIRVKRTNRKPTHEDVLTSDFVSVGSVSFYTDDWVKVKVIGRGDSGVNKSFAEYLIYYDGANYNIELLNNIVIGDNSGFPLLRMNGSNLEIKNRDSVNAGNYLIYFDDFIAQTLFSGKTYRVEDFPLIWINDLYYNTYKDNTFVPNQNISIPNQSDYDTVTSIFLNIKSLTTDFTGTLLGKFNNLSNLQCVSNQISVLDVSQNTNLTQLICYGNKIQTLDVSQLVNLNRLECKSNRLDAATNSQLLIDLDTNGQSNGILNSSIFGGGFITPTGIDSFNDLLSKSWNIVGLTNQITSGATYNVEDFPKIWIDNLYYNTYKGDTFVPSVNTLMTGQTEYDSVTNIFLDNQSLTTDFTNTLLSKFSNLNRLDCYNNSINVLDVSNITSFTQLRCYTNSISVLDVSNLVNLNILRCENNQISVLDVSNLTNLTTLTCGDNSISVLDVSNLVNATVITCGYNSISVLDVSNLTNLITLYCYYNSISVLDVSQLVNLNNLQCQGNQLDAAANSQILVDFDGNGLSNGYFSSSIFGGGFITPTGIDSFNALLSKSWNILGLTNQINAGSTYNVEDFPKIWIDNLYYNTYNGDTFVLSVNTLMTGQIEYDAVTIIDLNTQSLTTDFTNTLLKKFSNLQELKVNNNSIQVLDPSELYELIVLDCHNNSIEVLDVSQLTELTTLYCYINQIGVLNTTNLTKLVNLVCYVNQIEVLDTSQLVDLLVIDCQYNSIEVLDISNSLDLNFLRCNNNQIPVLDVSQLTKLNYIDCNSNQIQSLDTSLLNLLTTFYCHNNLLTNLDISQNVNLVNLTCYGNQLDNLVNSQILIDLDTNGLSNGFLNSSIFGGGSLTAAGQIAKINLLSKGWTIVGI